MSLFRRDNEEIPWQVLLNELKRRFKYNENGLCHYCGQPFDAPMCDSMDAHRKVSWVMREVDQQ